MIKNASEILEKFIAEEAKKLEGTQVPHMPLLGTAYEEITKKGIDNKFVIPKGLDLSVVSGLISIEGQTLPEQIDCMLVVGKGEPIGLTGQFTYPIEAVLCIFEVKKTLRKSDFKDAMEHLKKIRKKFAKYFEKKLIDYDYQPNLQVPGKHFKSITGKDAPTVYSQIHNLSKEDGILFYSLVQESEAPVSIIHSYSGYKTESGFRKAFIDIIDKERDSDGKGYGIPSIPGLITSGDYCLIKGNGVPYMLTKGVNDWVAVASTRHNPAYIMLEIIWSKISVYFDLAMPWDDTLERENLSPLLIAKAIKLGDKSGWKYQADELPEKKLRRESLIQWAPVKISKAAVALINVMMLVNGGELKLSKKQGWLLKEHGVSFEKVIVEMVSTGLFVKDNGYLKPRTTHTFMATNTDDSVGYLTTERKMLDLWLKERDEKLCVSNLIYVNV